MPHFFLMYFLTTFITIFFEAAIIIIIRGRLNGQQLTFKDGLNGAFSKVGKIFAWSLFSATIGVILKMISDRSQILGKIVIMILGAAWGVLTFFIAPVLIVENFSIKESLKKSAETIKRVWGETVIVNVGVGLYFGLLFLAGFAVFILTLFSANKAIIIVGAVALFVYILALIVMSATLSVVFRMVLYEYANTGNVPQGFSPEVISMAFREKKKKNSMGIGST